MTKTTAPDQSKPAWSKPEVKSVTPVRQTKSGPLINPSKSEAIAYRLS